MGARMVQLREHGVEKSRLYCKRGVILQGDVDDNYL